jgi:hypothetical protein
MVRHRQSGSIKLGTWIVMLTMFTGIYLGYKVLPPMITNFEFQDDIDRQARYSLYSYADGETIRLKVLERARTLRLPVTVDQIHVERSADRVTIRVKYDLPIRVPVHPFKLHFDDSTQESRL